MSKYSFTPIDWDCTNLILIKQLVFSLFPFKAHRHEVTICNYEASANPADHKVESIIPQTNFISWTRVELRGFSGVCLLSVTRVRWVQCCVLAGWSSMTGTECWHLETGVVAWRLYGYKTVNAWRMWAESSLINAKSAYFLTSIQF